MEGDMCGTTMQGSDLPAGRSVELYVRSLAPDGYHQSQTSILDRTATLVESGTLTDRHVHVWGRQVPVAGEATRTAVGEYVLDRVGAFREWAAANGCSLSPAFELREVEDTIAGEQFRAIRLPTAVLVEYVDDALVCVTPHTEGSAVRTVSDRLTALETGDQTQFEPLDEATVEAPPTRADRGLSAHTDDEEGLLTTE